jgi:hypothetical protein
MIEIFVLIGWIDGFKAGGVVSQEFFSLDTCEAAKAKYVEMHELEPNGWGGGRFSGSWVECVKK